MRTAEAVLKEYVSMRVLIDNGELDNVIEAMKQHTREALEYAITETVQICKEHTEDGCIDHEGAEANAKRIILNIELK